MSVRIMAAAIVCDHPGCTAHTHNFRTAAEAKQEARALAWLLEDDMHSCPEHREY